MKYLIIEHIVFIFLATLCSLGHSISNKCGCKAFSPCYAKMLETLRDQDEAYCIEDAAIGTSTVTIFIKALETFCGDIFTVETNPLVQTHDMRNLYEVTIRAKTAADTKEVPTIIIDAGQEAGTSSVRLALMIIERLVGCEENRHMIQSVNWVILPSCNPDGMEYSRFKKNSWSKNLRAFDDDLSFGVDISRNFDDNWGSCPKIESKFASNYPGPFAASENETIFIKQTLNKHKNTAKIYLSLRKNGHNIGYPFAFGEIDPNNLSKLQLVAGEVASKVNMRSAGVHLFSNDSIYNLQGKPHCGHSVDYAHNLGIKLAFQMRVFLESDTRIMSKFQSMPRGYDASLQNGYFSGIRELYNVLTNEKKYGDITK